jgi:hypothetical protein
MAEIHTVVVQIGNSDNKLTQVEWSDFIRNVHNAVSKISEVHFTGFSAPDAPWQNACFIINSYSMDGLTSELRFICKRFRQDSIALTIGKTEFVKG